MRPTTFLTALSFAAALVGARMHTAHTLRQFQAEHNSAPRSSSNEEIKSLILENEQLQRDIASLRALLTADAPIEVPAELISFVESELGLSFPTPPLVLLGNEDQLHNAAGQIWLAAFSEVGLEMRSYAFERLGIVPVNQNFMGQITAAQAVGATGVFDHSASEILLKSDFDIGNVHHQAALVRLLAIALLDNTYPLAQEIDDDHFHARQALHGGRASQLQERFYALQARHTGFVAQKENTEALELFHALPAYVRDITTFPNLTGKAFLATRATKAVATATLGDTKLNTRALIEQRPDMGIAYLPPTTLDSITQLQTQLGLLTVRSYLAPLKLENAKPLLASYLSDSLSIKIENDSPVIRWEVRWDTPQNASLFHSAVTQLADALESPPTITLEAEKVVFTVTDNNILNESAE